MIYNQNHTFRVLGGYGGSQILISITRYYGLVQLSTILFLPKHTSNVWFGDSKSRYNHELSRGYIGSAVASTTYENYIFQTNILAVIPIAKI